MSSGDLGPDSTPETAPLATLLFVAGDMSQVGKTTVCLGLLQSLLRVGFAPRHVAYIKPATQCESEQLIARWCHDKGP
jgi:dethiobiotin synthetase